MTWHEPVMVGGLRLVFDSDLNQHKRMPCCVPLKGNRGGVPASMVRQYRVQMRQADGSWKTIAREENNYQRLVRLPLDVRTSAVRIVPEATWAAQGERQARIFSIDVLADVPQPLGAVEDGPAWPDVVARVPARDLAAPESGLEAADGGKRTGD